MPIQLTRENLPEFVEARAGAVLEWEAVEQQLFFIFSALVRAASPEVSSAIFQAVMTFKTRLTMIDAAARFFLSDGDLFLEWRTLSDRVREKAKHRNRLSLLTSFLNPTENEMSRRFESTALEVSAKPNDDYDLRQLREWRNDFQILAVELHDFLDRVGAAPSISPQLQSSPYENRA